MNFIDFKNYYSSQDFVRGLKNYFKIEINREGVPIILHMDRRFNKNVSVPHYALLEENGQDKSVYFAIIFYYISLCNYVLEDLVGMDQLYNFSRCTNWPLTYCGLGGIMKPQQTLEEADLVYHHESENCRRAYAIFQEVVPFMKQELTNFFNGNDNNLNKTAYNQFCASMKDKIDEFWRKADQEIADFKFYYILRRPN